MSFDGKVAVVIGGGQTPGETIGNGRAAALMYAREGARVLVADRRLEAAQETVDVIRGEGLNAEAARVDVTVPDDLATLAVSAQRRFGQVHVLHNNVGVLTLGSTEELSTERWRQSIDVNLTGMWQSCKYFLPILRTSTNATIINISSLAGLISAAGSAIAYSTAKAAVNALTKSLALEYAPLGVRINCIAPGSVDTPLGVDEAVRSTGRTREEVSAERDRAIPMGRQGTAWDIARAARFLVSDDAAFITGVVLPVDGGASLMGVPASTSGRINNSEEK